MKKILLFRHESWIEFPHFINLLQEIGIPYELIKLDEGDITPKTIAANIGGLVFGGGTMSVNDPLPWIEDELALIRLAHSNKLPVLGHCFGSQLISKALGGEISPMANKEIGWHPIMFLDNKVASDWKGKIPTNTKIMLWHHDEFTIPEGAFPLYTTLNCSNQAFFIDNILAIVAHIELSSSALQDWLKIYGYDIASNGESVQSVEKISDDLENKMLEMHVLSDVFYRKWLKLVFPQDNYSEIHSRLESYLKSGSCLCEGVTFFLKYPRDVVNCHCTECRKFHGNYAAFTKIKHSNIYIFGKEKINWYQVENKQTRRGFCKNCGSSLFWSPAGDDSICVAAGALDTPTKLTTTKNIYIDNKSDCYVLDDTLEAYSTTMKNRPIEVNALGKHSLIELIDFKKQDNKDIKKGLFELAKIVGGKVLHDYFYEFDKYSISGFLLLKESHISIHTWPEHNYAALDIFMCKIFDRKEVEEVLFRLFQSRNVLIKDDYRGRWNE